MALQQSQEPSLDICLLIRIPIILLKSQSPVNIYALFKERGRSLVNPNGEILGD